MGADAVTADREHIFSVYIATSLHAQFAQDATVEVEQDVGMAGIDRPVRVKLFKMRALHADLIGGGLQQAVAALFARRTKMIALDKQHLQQGLALRVQLSGA